MQRQKSMKHKNEPSAKSSVFNSNEKISSMSFDSISQYNNGHLACFNDGSQNYHHQFEDQPRHAEVGQATQEDSLAVG